MRKAFTCFLLLSGICCFSQKQQLPKLFISNPDYHIKDDTLADGSSVFVIENIDGDFLTSIALLHYVSTAGIIISNKKVRKHLIKYDDLITTIKKNKNNFFEKYEYYILEPYKEGYFKAFKVYRADYMEDKDRTGLDILSDF